MRPPRTAVTYAYYRTCTAARVGRGMVPFFVLYIHGLVSAILEHGLARLLMVRPGKVRGGENDEQG